MDLGAVMREIGARLSTVTGLRAFPYPPDAVAPPAAFPDYPERIDFDGTYRRGMDRIVVPVAVVVGRTADRSSWNALVQYCNGSGASSVKAALETGTSGAFDGLRVTGVEFGEMTIAGVPYVAAMFTVEVIGRGG